MDFRPSGGMALRLLLLPGMDGTGHLFEPLIQALPASINAVAASYPTDLPLGYDQLLPMVESMVTEEPFVVLGESFSGPLAVMLAATRPQSLCGVVLCASFIQFPLPVPERWRNALKPWMFRLQPLGLLSLVLLGSHGFGKLGSSLRNAVRSVSPAAFAARARSVANVDVTKELKACSLPLLYLQARRDLVIRPNSWKRIRAARPDAELAVLDGPHLVLQVSPQQAAERLLQFLNRCDPSYQP